MEFLCANEAQDFVEQREETVYFLTGRAGQIFERAKAVAFKKVDVKGQI